MEKDRIPMAEILSSYFFCALQTTPSLFQNQIYYISVEILALAWDRWRRGLGAGDKC